MTAIFRRGSCIKPAMSLVDRRRRREATPDDESSDQPIARRPRTEHQDSPPSPDPIPLRRLTHEHYTIAWICALHLELAAAISMLDKEHDELPTQDDNHYVLGNIGKHNIVIACLPDGHYGNIRATSVLNHLRSTFTSVKRCLLVGIGAGFPRPPLVDIRLGDVVVGQKVTCHDEGKVKGNGRFQRTGDSMRPSQDMATALSVLRARHEDPEAASQISDTVRTRLEGKPAYQHQSIIDDLYTARYIHPEAELDCANCDSTKIIPRLSRSDAHPSVHYGTIASGNTLIKSGVFRDRLARDLDVICAEMEAAGLMGIMPTLVIRGVSDYADSHKNKLIQRNAAANAAAFARIYLAVLRPHVVLETCPVEPSPPAQPPNGSDQNKQRRANYLSAMQFSQMNARQFAIKGRLASTCEWLLQHETYISWRDDSRTPQHKGFIWLRGKPGSGKSTLMKFAYESHKKKRARGKLKASQVLMASFFFHARGEELQKSIEGMYRSLVLQLLKGFPDLQDLLDDTELLPEGEDGCPSLDQLQVLFERGVARLGNRQFICYVDALDECAEKDVASIVRVFQDLAEEQNQECCRFRVFFSSRHYPHIQARIGLQLELEGMPGHTEDLTQYACKRLQYQEPTFRQKLIRKANGVFMWLVLVVDDLNSLDSRGQPQSVAQEDQLEKLPGDLSDLFSQILSRYKGYMDEFIVAVIWILFSDRPLSPAEFDHAIWSGTVRDTSEDPPVSTKPLDEESSRLQRRVTSSCKGLAEVTTHDRFSTVQFIHESVRDFLLKDGGLANIWPQNESSIEHQSHVKLRDCCDRYLKSPVILRLLSSAELIGLKDWSPSSSAEPNDLKAYSLLYYAVINVFYHADVAAQSVRQKKFLHDFSIPTWTRASNFFTITSSMLHSSETDMLYILAADGHARLIRELGEPLPMDCTSAGTFGSPLIVALSGKHTEVVATLLELPVSQCGKLQLLNPRGGVRYGKNRSLLTWSAESGHKNLLLVLLARGVPLEAKDAGGCTALARAVNPSGDSRRNRDQRSYIYNFLIEKGANWEPDSVILNYGKKNDNFKRVYTSYLFSISLEHGHRQIWRKLLVERGHHKAGWLKHAVENGSLEAMELLLDSKEDKTDYHSYVDLLRAALRNSHIMLAERLIEKGADIWGGGDWFRSSFRVAVQQDSIFLLTWLVDQTSVRWHERYGKNPLLEAIESGSVNMAAWLIEHGADVEGRGAWRSLRDLTPLMVAACHISERIEMVHLLLKAGVNVFARDSLGNTALDIAKTYDRSVEFVQLLEDNMNK